MSAQLFTNAIDPTEGLIQFIQNIKPYHSKILEVEVEHIYQDNVNVTITEKTKWESELLNDLSVDILTTCDTDINWNTSRLTDDYPPVRILEAVGNKMVEVLPYSTQPFDPLSPEYPELLINVNPDGILFNVDDIVIFGTDGILPSTNGNPIISGVEYYVVEVNNISNNTTIKVSETINGTPIVFTDIGNDITFINFPHNPLLDTFLVEPEEYKTFTFLVSDINANNCRFVKMHNVVGVNPSLKRWIFEGDLISNFEIISGCTIYIREDSAEDANSVYTVVSAILTVAGNTQVTVSESISLQAIGNGKVGIAYSETMSIPYQVNYISNYWPSPNWVAHCKVKVYSTGTLPTPLVQGSEYYYIPLPTIGTFALSMTKYPTTTFDYINMSTFGTGVLTIIRSESFYIGATVDVHGTDLSKNDGIYFINGIAPENGNIRIKVMQRIPRISRPDIDFDGIMSLIINPQLKYCQLTQAPSLYTEAFIHESISFRFSSVENEYLGTHIIENHQSEISSPIAGYTINPIGYDTQFFGMGSIDQFPEQT